MRRSCFVALARAAWVLGLVSSAPAAAQQRTYVEAIQTAKALMLNGRTADARSLLQDLAKQHRNSNDIDFLLGMLAVDSRDYDLAVRHFRAMLVREPRAVRVRLEPARAFYLKRDYDNAFRQFQFARAGKLPPGAGATIDRFLAAIRREKSWSYSFSVAVAPDTNINNGTSAREVELFGLPFELSEDTRRRSGIGAAIEAGAELAPRISEHVRLKVGGALLRREYEGKEFDDTTVALYAGPRLMLDKWDLSATGTAFQRRFGGSRLNEGFGVKIDGTYYKDARTALSLSLAAQQIRYPRYPLQTGPAYSAWAGFIRALTPSSSLNARIGVSRKTARVPELASWSQSFSVGYYRDLAGGFSIYAEPGFTRSHYDAADPFFEARRKDNVSELRLAVLNRRIVMQGFTPRVSFTLTRRKSTIELFDYTQRRIELGFTSAF
jgi:outer membrane protein